MVKLCRAMLLVLPVLFWASTGTSAEDGKASGKVKVTKEGDKVAKIEIVGAKTLEVVLDAEGNKLAAMDGKEVDVTGKIEGTKITVKTAAEKKGGGDPEEGGGGGEE